MSMSKQEIAGIIKEAASLYSKELLDRNLLIIYDKKTNPSYKEILFERINFLHLTGVKSKIIGKNIQNLFFRKALDGNISPKDFDVNPNGTSEMKLIVIKQALLIAHNAKRIGDYNNRRPMLIADNVAGTKKWCIACKDIGTRFIRPCSLLNDDIQNNVIQNFPILAVFRKKRNVPLYSEISCVGKDIDISRLAVTIDKLYPELLARTLYGTEKNPHMTSPTVDPYIAVEYKIHDGICSKSAELFIGTKTECDRMTQLYAENNQTKIISTVAEKATMMGEWAEKAIIKAQMGQDKSDLTHEVDTEQPTGDEL